MIHPGPKAAQRGRCGFVLVEMLIVMAVMASTALAMTRVLTWTMRMMRETEQRHADLAAMDHLMRQLRSDAWGASALHADEQQVRMVRPDGREVRWRMGQEGIQRIAGDEVQVWRSSATISFDVQGPAVVVRFGPEGQEGEVQARAISQLLLLGGGEP